MLSDARLAYVIGETLGGIQAVRDISIVVPIYLAWRTGIRWGDALAGRSGSVLAVNRKDLRTGARSWSSRFRHPFAGSGGPSWVRRMAGFHH